MKLLYVFLDETRSPGVLQKVRGKIAALNNLGINTRGIFLTPHIEEERIDEAARIEYIPLRVKPLPHIFNRRYLRDYKWLLEAKRKDRTKYARLARAIEKYDFDFILMRYPLGTRGLYNTTTKFRNRIIFEHNSKELVELNLFNNGKNRTLSYILQNEEKFGPLSLENARALTGVGHEVVQYELSRISGASKPVFTVPNGIDVKEYPVSKRAAFDSETVKLLFVTGSPSPWVGIDVVLRSLANYPARQKVKLYIVGPRNDEHVTLAQDLGLGNSVEFTGQKSKDELDAYFNSCHVAIGTIAMHRVGLSEHSSLKVCEYAARGIPFVLGYDDTNFYRSQGFAPFFRKLNVKDDLFNFNEVVDFAHKVAGEKDVPAVMHELALREVDFGVQMKRLAGFLESLE